MAKEFNEGKFQITENENVYEGPNSKIDSVTLSSGDHTLKLLRKKFRGYSIEFMDGPKWHTALKEKGYPVFPTFRYDKANETEYITDLRRGGTHKVIDFCNSIGIENVRISNIEQLEADMKKLLDKSVTDGLVINEPNIFFDIEISTGIAKVILGDLRELGYDSIHSGHIPSDEEILIHNQEIFKEHMDRLEAIMI